MIKIKKKPVSVFDPDPTPVCKPCTDVAAVGPREDTERTKSTSSACAMYIYIYKLIYVYVCVYVFVYAYVYVYLCRSSDNLSTDHACTNCFY